MKKIEVKKYRLNAAKHCFVFRGGVAGRLSRVYGRDVALKVFDLETINKPEDFLRVKWGDDPVSGEPRKNTLLWEATQIQNIASWHDLAPRIYGLETVHIGGDYRPAQIIEFIEGKHPTIEKAYSVYQQVIRLGSEFGFGIDKEDVSNVDVMGDHLIDFQTFAFTELYEETAKRIYCEKGKYGKVYYQDVPEVGLQGGPRKSLDRIKYLQLDKIDFKNKVVVDIGCAGGFFCRYAVDRGAKRVLGVDLNVDAARHMSNLLGYFNIDYLAADVRKWSQPTAISDHFDGLKPDILFMLSMNLHIKTPDWLSNAEIVVFEDNSYEGRDKDTLNSPWTDWFDEITFVGRGEDHGAKACYHLRKEAK